MFNDSQSPPFKIIDVLCFHGDEKPEVYYRFSDPSEDRNYLYLEHYAVDRHTPAGVWLRDGTAKGKFVLKGSGRRFAYSNKAEALDSYRKRKRWQIKHGQRTLNNGNRGLELAEQAKELINQGVTDA